MNTPSSSSVFTQEKVNLHPVVAERRSTLAFSNRKIEKEKIVAILEAGRWAPSSYNEQPWRFVVATQDEPEQFKAILKSLAESNQAWAKNAYALISIVVKTESAYTRQPNAYAWHDAGVALGQMLSQATAQGLFMHTMGGFNRIIARQNLQIPEGYEPVTMVALGYPGEVHTLSPALQEREKQPRKRLPLHEIAFSGSWGEALQQN